MVSKSIIFGHDAMDIRGKRPWLKSMDNPVKFMD